MPLPALTSANAFCDSYDLRVPLLMAPMAGACPPALAIAVAKAGGMGACGCLLMSPDQITDWAAKMRSGSNGAFQMNMWIPDSAPQRDAAHEAEVRAFLASWGPPVPAEAADAPLPDFDAQCAAMLAAGPHVISSIMGVYPPPVVAVMKDKGIRWFATATTVAEALEAEAAGADVIVAQGMEAGGHRGAFNADDAAGTLVGLFSLLPAVVDAVRLPVVATGGIADARGVAAALMLGASAVQIGTGLLRTPEAGIASAWAEALGTARPEDTAPTCAFSGRLGRAIRTRYVTAAEVGPTPAPYPIQRGLTAPMRAAATSVDTMQAWAGQSAALASSDPADQVIESIWNDTKALLGA